MGKSDFLKNIIIVGCSGHAKVIVDIIELSGIYKIKGFFDRRHNDIDQFCGYPVLDSDSNINKYITDLNIYGGIIAIGDNFDRKKIADNLMSANSEFNFINAVHPAATVARSVTLGGGNAIMAGATINSDAEIGSHCILNTNCSLGHDSKMLDYSCLSPNSAIGGGSIIGKYSIIGMSATVIHLRKVGNNCVIGACSLVNKDISDNTVSMGVPAKHIRNRELGERYL
jgi:sugar O-acyltransferase (sialic acid O-acetyltransferase NeuD family)